MKELKEFIDTLTNYNDSNIKRIIKGKSTFPFVLFVSIIEDGVSAKTNIHFVKDISSKSNSYDLNTIQKAFAIDEVRQYLIEVA